jgi:hypothetical protein
MSTPIVINSATSGGFWMALLNGREHLVTNMVSIVGDSVMNKKFYPDSVVTANFSQLDSLPAPNGHPLVNGQATSAFHPCAINACNFGAFIRNPVKKSKQVINELWVDVVIANQSDDGKELVSRIENREPVGVSTGLFADVEEVAGVYGGKEYSSSVTNMKFDHVAVLLRDKPAGDNTYTVNGQELIVNSIVENSYSVSFVRARVYDAIKATGGRDCYIEDLIVDDETNGTVVYEEYSEGSNYYKQSFTVDSNEMVTLEGDPEKVLKKVEFLTVESGDAPLNNHSEDINMAKQDEGSTLETNGDAATSGAVTVETAIELLESKGFVINSEKEAGDLRPLIENKDRLLSLLEAEDDEMGKVRERIVSNSNMTDEDLKDMSPKMLTRLASSFGVAMIRNGYTISNQSEEESDAAPARKASYAPVYDDTPGAN